MKKLTLILLCSLMFAGQRAWSRVTLPTHFTSNMVCSLTEKVDYFESYL